MKRYESMAALLANDSITNLLNTAAVFRFLPNGEIVIILDGFRGNMSIPKGVDLKYFKVNPQMTGLGLTAELPGEIFGELLMAVQPKDDLWKVWRFGCSPVSEITEYTSDGTKTPITFETNGMEMLFDDDLRPFVVCIMSDPVSPEMDLVGIR